jgi:hypothetical protein
MTRLPFAEFYRIAGRYSSVDRNALLPRGGEGFPEVSQSAIICGICEHG